MKTYILITAFIICSSYIYADIRPNPIKAKGIITGYSTSIRMVSELVVVDLYKDSANVKCYFYMQNDSDAQNITIGFPGMNFHHYSYYNGDENSKIDVYENEEHIEDINLFRSDTILFRKKFPNTKSVDQQNENQPWFWWNSSFTKGEMKEIMVCYSLPHGSYKDGSRYFTYLLNTGLGWKGNIGTAEIMVNLVDISPDLILKATPDNYSISDNKINWTFTDFEPSIKDDIKIYYEPYKGCYKLKSKENKPTIVVNDEVFPDIDLLGIGDMDLESFATLINVKAEDIESIEVLKDEALSRYNSTNGVIRIYTKNYEPDK